MNTMRLLITLLLLTASTVTFANYYRSSCLDICFKTGHDCRYCAYQCDTPDRDVPDRDYSDYSICPLVIHEGYKRY